TSVCFLVGSVAISAIPPLNGFVAEWFTYQGMFSIALSGGIAVKLLAAFAAVSLAITGALAVTCFVKAYGVTFLAAPRSEYARNARDVPGPMKAGMAVLAVVCVCLGLGAPWVAPVMESIASATTNAPALAVAAGADAVNPVLGSAVSTPLVAVLLIALV